jgi:hypothetical protein
MIVSILSAVIGLLYLTGLYVTNEYMDQLGVEDRANGLPDLPVVIDTALRIFWPISVLIAATGLFGSKRD